jgi:hypothetical protein
MKKIFLSIFIAFAIFGALVSCNKDSGLTNATLPMRVATATAANPAITWVSGTVIRRKDYQTIAVMDTDATHQTNIYTASTTSESEQNPTWSPTAGSIAWRLFDGTGATASSIELIDVSVNASGIAVGSNARTIYSTTNADSVSVNNPAWCSTTATGKIAFVRQYIGSNLGLSELCTISQSGGAVTVLASYKQLDSKGYVISHFTYPTWNPDDSKIAVIREDTVLHSTIMIFDASTGVALDSIPITGSPTAIEWSRTGMNKLVYAYTPNSSTARSLYYVTPTTGSTPTTNSISGVSQTWSPNNSSVMYANSSLMKVIPLTSTTTTVNATAPGNKMNWKK